MFSLFSHFKTTQKTSSNCQAGFGLIELMVSVAVMAIVSSIILVKQNSFNGGVILRSQAYEIALAAREAQLNAVSAVGVTGNFRTLQGLHFDTGNATDGIFRVFRDADNDGFFDTNEALGQQGSLDSRFEIRTIRVGGTSVGQVSIVFERPNFDARFFTAANTEATLASSVEIEVARRNTATNVCGTDFRTIEITQTGQISVQECP